MALAFISLLLWEAWQKDYVIPEQQAQEQLADQSSAGTSNSDAPHAPIKADIDGTPTTVPGAAAATSIPGAEQQGTHLIHVLTDTLDLHIDTRGGNIVDAKLVQYPVSIEKPNVKFELMSRRPSNFFIAQTGLLGADKARTPTHEAVFTASKDTYHLAEGQNQLVVDLSWTSPDGMKVTKRYTFERGKYAVKLQDIVDNASKTAWTGREYRQLQRGKPETSGNRFMHTYTGGAIYSETDKYQKYSFDELAEGKLNRDVKDGWVAMIQHYFLAAFIPPTDRTEHFYGKKLANGHWVIGTYTPAKTVAPGQQASFDGKMYIGPKLQSRLESAATGLELTVDYGWLVFIAKPMHWVLDKIDSIVGNWGWTIIIFTILIKGVFFKLSETSYKSMANMRKLGPRIQALKDRYGDDKQRMQQAMMEMYKKEKINPLGGCLPMVVQIPFFISLYWVLLENVEMRQAPWIFWIRDLSVQDPHFVLPVIMAVSMFIQQKLNPAPPDPMQAKIMMFLPLVFGVMFAFFPAGLVLYWVTNNILSIAQQWVITRRIEAGEKA
jgi:YidC/Oxa1 family membrane protein insertase